jgi:tetratricopeptide (TPR) repeat protein
MAMSASFAGPTGNQAPSLQDYLRGVEARVRGGDQAGAMQLATEAVAAGREHVNLFILAAHGALADAELDRALVYAERAREIGPRHPDALNVVGLALVKLRRFRGGIEAYDLALRIMPSAAHLHFNKGQALEELNETEAARVEFRRVLALDPNHSDALARLANLAVLAGDVTPARDYAERALQSNPGNVAAILALATADVQEKHFEPALSRLASLTGSPALGLVNLSIAQGLTGDALDGLARTDEAFATYQASNGALRQYYRRAYERPDLESALARVNRVIEYFESASADAWRARADAGAEDFTHVFLVGFPRSGTTLLEQVLAAHPDIETLEERDCLVKALEDFVVPPNGLSLFAQLNTAGLAPYRDAYWATAKEYGAKRNRRVFVDKLPLNSVLLCLVAKLFPDAKILFAVRDPRDVVLSCFRRRFEMNLQMYELLTLAGAASYYDRVMRLSDLYRDKLGLPTHLLRHEDLVRDFASETQKLCEFLDLPAAGSMADFAEHARAKSINTPSATQVARGLYSEGMGQWRRYESHLAPVMPILAPWAARFGYGTATK